MSDFHKKIHPMKKWLKPDKVGKIAIEYFEVSEEEASFTRIRSIAGNSGLLNYVPSGEYTRLTINGSTWMSDTPMETGASLEAVWKAHRRVLIGGLGMGTILVPMMHNPEVEEIVVIEINKDVIDLIVPQLREAFPEESKKLKVIHADLMEWKPEKGEKFNVMFFDIWRDICLDNLDDIGKLHRRFAHYKDRSDPKVWMDSWMCDYLRKRRRQEQRQTVAWGWT